ncbi:MULTISPECIES: DNA-formamidopyrimidine glycosylase family protein [Arthrobacter]|uniref:Fpg/Nei family DNA glycosylase n=1 Tax=Arthrobacter terricola TaxID=2547396 RepID=A0A4R5K898_9MICC|nr:MULTISPECIES: DNA-formamidopyrimidine glycosylase family protein [Arthrobacter]MBT8159331.1 Fpg/Nei family DNA glycosylase [Arthrobacter sp. GN70]TDF91363.1 Fpg/Nei family DNA glycosylase [Arthrobacter terricola]
MPELPEITALATFLDQRLSGSRITDALLPSKFALKISDVPFETLIGRTVESVGRQGKFIIVKIAPDGLPETGDSGLLFLVVNFAKTGWLTFSETQPGEDAPSPDGYFAARFDFENDDRGYQVILADTGTWKGLTIFVVKDPIEVKGIAELGPEPLDPAFGINEFSKLFTHRQQVKGLLKDQKLIAGIGNAYSDEILHAAKLSPVVAASSLDPEALQLLYTTMNDILSGAVQEFTGLHPGELKAAKKSSMRVHGRTGEPCPVCSDSIREVAFVGTSLQYCPTCQTDGEVLVKRGSPDVA